MALLVNNPLFALASFVLTLLGVLPIFFNNKTRIFFHAIRSFKIVETIDSIPLLEIKYKSETTITVFIIKNNINLTYAENHR